MPRTPRASAGGLCYHVLNRGNARAEVFHDARDYAEFVQLLYEETETRKVRLLAYCLLPDHFHLVLWPRKDGDLSHWMQWLSTSHVRRYHRLHQTSGHIWEGRFRAFPDPARRAPADGPAVCRAESHCGSRNLSVRKPQRWPWSSISKEVAGLDRPTIADGARSPRQEMAGIGPAALDGRGVGAGAAQCHSRHAAGRRQVAETDCSEIRASIDDAAPRPSAQDARRLRARLFPRFRRFDDLDFPGVPFYAARGKKCAAWCPGFGRNPTETLPTMSTWCPELQPPRFFPRRP